MSESPNTDQPTPEISVVVPCHGEEGNIGPLVCRLTAVLTDIGDTFEIILIDDGSRDNTLERMRTRL